MDEVTELWRFWGFFCGFFFGGEMPPTPQPIRALPNAAFSPWGGFTPKHQPNPSAKTSLISCVGAKPN